MCSVNLLCLGGKYFPTYLQEYESDNAPKRDARPEDLVRATKGVTLSTAKAVQAGSSCRQEDITACANMGRQALTNMMIICKVK